MEVGDRAPPLADEPPAAGFWSSATAMTAEGQVAIRNRVTLSVREKH